MTAQRPWMVQRKDGLSGPYSTAELKTEISLGRVSLTDSVRFGDGNFRRISEFSVLAVGSVPKNKTSQGRPVLWVAFGVLAVVALAAAGFLWRSGRESGALSEPLVSLVKTWPLPVLVPARSAAALRAELDYIGCARVAQADFSLAPALPQLATFADCVALAADVADKHQRQELLERVQQLIAQAQEAALLLPSKALLAHSLGNDEEAHLALAAAASELRGDARAALVQARLEGGPERLLALAKDQPEALSLVVKELADRGQIKEAIDILQKSALGDFAANALRRLLRQTYTGDVVWRDLQTGPLDPQLIIDVGFFAAAAGESAQSQRGFFEPRLADAKLAPLAALAVSGLLCAENRDPEARAELQQTTSLPPESGRGLLQTVLALRAGSIDEAQRSSLQAGPLVEARYFSALVAALKGDLSRLKSLQPEIPGPLVAFALAALAKEHDPTLRLEGLLGRDDGLCELNPAHLPLFDGGLRALLQRLQSPDDGVLRSLAHIWLGEAPEPAAGAPWLPAVLAYQKKQYARAAQILGPIAHGDGAEPAILGLYGRVLEQVEPDWADDFYKDLDDDDATAAELGRLRLSVLRGAKAQALEQALALFKDGTRSPAVMHVLLRGGEASAKQ